MLWAGPVTLATLSLIGGLLAATTGNIVIQPLLSAILGEDVSVSLHLWEGFNIAVILSLVTIAIGTTLYLLLDRVRAMIAGILDFIGWGPDKGFDQAIAGLGLHLLRHHAAHPVRPHGRLHDDHLRARGGGFDRPADRLWRVADAERSFPISAMSRSTNWRLSSSRSSALPPC
jgi:hypothetical protein